MTRHFGVTTHSPAEKPREAESGTLSRDHTSPPPECSYLPSLCTRQSPEPLQTARATVCQHHAAYSMTARTQQCHSLSHRPWEQRPAPLCAAARSDGRREDCRRSLCGRVPCRGSETPAASETIEPWDEVCVAYLFSTKRVAHPTPSPYTSIPPNM